MEDLSQLESIATDAEAIRDVGAAIGAWRKAIAAAPERSEPRRALAHLLRREERWSDLLAALRNEIDRSCQSADEKYAVLMEIVDIHLHRLDRSFQAIDAAKRALDVKPDGVEALETLITIYEQKRSFTDLLQLLERRAEQCDDAGLRLRFLERIAEVSLERTQGGRQAVQAYERILAQAPDHRVAIDKLGALYTQLGAWDKLVQLKKDHVLPSCGGDKAVLLAVELAELAQQKVKRVELQLELWLKVRELDPLHSAALEALDNLYRRQRAWSELSEVLASRVEISADPDSRSELLQRLALLYEEHLRGELGAEVQVIAIWGELLALNPGNQRARNALREIYLRRGDLDALEELYTDHDARGYAFVIEQLLRRKEVPQRARLLRRIARLYREDLANPRKAIESLESLCRLEPSDREAVQELVALYEDSGDQRKLADVLTRLLHLTDDAEDQLVLYQRLALLYEERLAWPSEALRCWLGAVSLRPDDGYLTDEAERLAQESGEWQRLIDVYREVAKPLPAEDRVAFLMTVARVQEDQLRQLDQVGATYEAVLETEPAHLRAQEGLARALLAQGRYEALFEHYLRRLDTGAQTDDADVPAARMSIYYEVSELLEQRIHKPDEALEMLGRALWELPGDAQTLDRLEGLATRHGLWKPLLHLYREVTKRPLPVAAQVELRNRVARLYEERFSNPTRALRAYRRVLDLDPRNTSARHAVVRLASLTT